MVLIKDSTKMTGGIYQQPLAENHNENDNWLDPTEQNSVREREGKLVPLEFLTEKKIIATSALEALFWHWSETYD